MTRLTKVGVGSYSLGKGVPEGQRPGTIINSNAVRHASSIMGLQWEPDKTAGLKASLSTRACNRQRAVSFLVCRGTGSPPQVCWGNLSVLRSLRTYRDPGCGPALASSTSGSWCTSEAELDRAFLHGLSSKASSPRPSFGHFSLFLCQEL